MARNDRTSSTALPSLGAHDIKSRLRSDGTLVIELAGSATQAMMRALETEFRGRLDGARCPDCILNFAGVSGSDASAQSALRIALTTAKEAGVGRIVAVGTDHLPLRTVSFSAGAGMLIVESMALADEELTRLRSEDA